MVSSVDPSREHEAELELEPIPEVAGTLAYTHPLTDRRRSTRHKQMFVTQMTPWAPGYASIPFEVILADVSENGAGVIHDRELKIGMRHLLTVPRGEGERPIIREYAVIRCERRPDAKYAVGLEVAPSRTTGISAAGEHPSVTSPRLKLLFLAFGFAGLLVAAFYPL
jgi:hypothetical protein